MKYQEPRNKVQDLDTEKKTDLAPKKSDAGVSDKGRNAEAGSDDEVPDIEHLDDQE